MQQNVPKPGPSTAPPTSSNSVSVEAVTLSVGEVEGPAISRQQPPTQEQTARPPSSRRTAPGELSLQRLYIFVP